MGRESHEKKVVVKDTEKKVVVKDTEKNLIIIFFF